MLSLLGPPRGLLFDRLGLEPDPALVVVVREDPPDGPAQVADRHGRRVAQRVELRVERRLGNS